MDPWKKVLRSELSFSREGNCRRPYGLITKSLQLKYCSRRKQSLRDVFKHSRSKDHKRHKKRKITCGGRKNLKDHWPFAWWLLKMTLHHWLSPENSKSFRMIFSENTFGELLLVFQLFEQFFSGIYFIFKFQKLFSHRILENGYTLLHFLKVFRNVLS